MKILQELKATFIVSASEEYTSKKTGQKGFLYYVTFMQHGRATTLSCTKEAFEKMNCLEAMTNVVFITEYNVDYKVYKIVDIV